MAENVQGKLSIAMDLDSVSFQNSLRSLRRDVRTTMTDMRGDLQTAQLLGDKFATTDVKVSHLSTALSEQSELLGKHKSSILAAKAELQSFYKANEQNIQSNGKLRRQYNALTKNVDKQSKALSREEGYLKRLTRQYAQATAEQIEHRYGIEKVEKSHQNLQKTMQNEIKAYKASGKEYLANGRQHTLLKTQLANTADEIDRNRKAVKSLSSQYASSTKQIPKLQEQLKGYEQREKDILAETSKLGNVEVEDRKRKEALRDELERNNKAMTNASIKLAKYQAKQEATNKLSEQTKLKLSALNAQRAEETKALFQNELGLKRAATHQKAVNSENEKAVASLITVGKTYQANSLSLKTLSLKEAGLLKQYKLQSVELEHVQKTSGKASDAYATQAAKLNDLKVKLAATNQEMKIASRNTFNHKGMNSAADWANKYQSGLSHIGTAMVSVGKAAGYLSVGLATASIAGIKANANLQQSFVRTRNLVKYSNGESTKEVVTNMRKLKSETRSLSETYGEQQRTLATGFQELIKRGYSSSQALGSYRNMEKAAVATGDSFNDVIQSSAGVIEAFGLRTKSTAGMTRNTSRALNGMAYVADLSASSFKEMSVSMEYAGASGHSAGQSMENVAAAIGVLSNNGVQAQQAGTGMRKIFTSLISPTKAATGAMHQYGLKMSDLEDKSGKLKPLPEIFEAIHEKTKNLTKLQQVDLFHKIFGTTGQNAALILANNTKNLKDLSKQAIVGEKHNYINKLANHNMHTFAAQLKIAKANLSELQMVLGRTFMPIINKVLKYGIRIVSHFNKLPESVKESRLKMLLWIPVLSGVFTIVGHIAGHLNSIFDFASKISNFFGGRQLKLASEGRAVDELTVKYQMLNNARAGEPVGSPESAGEPTGSPQSAGMLNGLLQSAHSAGGFKNLTTAGKIGTVAAGAGVAIDSGMQLFNAYKDRHNADKRSQDIGQGVGSAIGGGIGLYFGGPLGAMVGSQIGKFAGKWGGVAVNKFTKGWQSHKPPKNFWSLENLGWSAKNMFSKDMKFVKKNGKELALTAVMPLLGIPALLYKNNKGFHKWVNGLGTWFKKNWKEVGLYFVSPLAGAINSLYKHNKGFHNWVNGLGTWFKKNWKEVGLYLVNPLAGAINSLYKHNRGFHKWVDGLVKGFKNAWKGVTKWWNKIWESINSNRYVKAFKKGKFFSTALKDMRSRFSAFNKWLSKKWSEAWKSFNSNRYVKAFKKSKFFSAALKDMKSRWSSFNKWLGKDWNSFWKSTQKWAKTSWDRTVKNWNGMWKSINSGWKSFKTGLGSGWRSFWKGLANFFGDIWKSIEKTALGGINGIVGVINGGISGIDNVIHSFGGKSHSVNLIPKVKLATGTLGNLTPSITHPTMALLNDGHDSPETGNKETIWDTKTGALGIVNGTNVPFALQPGMEVFSASQSRDLGFAHFAKGTNPFGGIGKFFGGIGSWIGQKTNQLKKWFELATKIVSHPIQSLNSLMQPSSKGLNGIFVQLGNGMFDKSKGAAANWWSALWNMASSNLNGDSGPAAGLLKAVEKYGKGHKYVWGAAGSDSFDCSGLVMYALKHAYGIDFPHFSGSQYGMTQHISRDQAKMGDLVFWGNHGDEHVGVYAGGNKYFSAQSPSQGIHMNTLDSVIGYGKPLFGRVRGLSQSNSKKEAVKATSGLQKLIKGQVGNGFFKFLSKLGDLFGITGEAGTPTGDHTHWMKQAHIPRSDWAGLNYIISAESGWNPKAVNPTSGTYGLGQMQGYNLHYYTKHGGKSNAIAQLMGMMDYIHDRYGSVTNAVQFRKSHNWYANGGMTDRPAIFGEDGPEMAIPLSPNKSARARELLGKTDAILSAQSGLSQQQVEIDRKKEKEEHDFRQAILLLLTQLVNKSNITDIKLTTPAGRALWEVVEPYSKQEQRAEQIRERRGLSGRFR